MLAIRSLVLSLSVVALAIAGVVAEDPTTSQLAVGVATHSQLNDATALANKDAVMTAQNVAVARSNLRAQQDDVVTEQEQQQMPVAAGGASDDTGAQPNDVPMGLVLTGDQAPLQTDTEGDATEQAAANDDADGELTFGGDQPPSDLTLTDERDALTSPDDKEHGGELEQFVGHRRRFFYPGFRGGYRGWRYPLPYWRRYGRRFYGGRCAFGRVYGGFFYC